MYIFIYTPSGREGVRCVSRRLSREPRPVSLAWPRARWPGGRSVAGPSCPPRPPGTAAPTQTSVSEPCETHTHMTEGEEHTHVEIYYSQSAQHINTPHALFPSARVYT